MNRTIKNFTIASLLFLGTIAQANAASDNRPFVNDDTSVQSSSRRTANPLSVRNILFTGLVAAATVGRATGFSAPATPNRFTNWFGFNRLQPLENEVVADLKQISSVVVTDFALARNATQNAWQDFEKQEQNCLLDLEQDISSVETAEASAAKSLLLKAEDEYDVVKTKAQNAWQYFEEKEKKDILYLEQNLSSLENAAASTAKSFVSEVESEYDLVKTKAQDVWQDVVSKVEGECDLVKTKVQSVCKDQKTQVKPEDREKNLQFLRGKAQGQFGDSVDAFKKALQTSKLVVREELRSLGTKLLPFEDAVKTDLENAERAAVSETQLLLKLLSDLKDDVSELKVKHSSQETKASTPKAPVAPAPAPAPKK